MEINMSGIELSKQPDGWVYIVEEWSDKVNNKIAKGTKLLYDPGNENDIKLIQQQITQMNDYNMWDLADDYAGTADWGLTLYGAIDLTKKSKTA